MNERETPAPGEADTPQQAHDEAAPEVRRLRIGDDAPQGDAPRDAGPPPAA